MMDSIKKSKPTLERLQKDSQVVAGKDLIKKAQEKELQKANLDDAIEFERRNGRVKRVQIDVNSLQDPYIAKVEQIFSQI